MIYNCVSHRYGIYPGPKEPRRYGRYPVQITNGSEQGWGANACPANHETNETPPYIYIYIYTHIYMYVSEVGGQVQP